MAFSFADLTTTFPEIGALQTRARLEEIGLDNSFYSFGRSHPGAITLHKTDATDQSAVDTATFQLWNDVDGNGVLDPGTDTTVGSPASTSGGTLTWPGLDWGTYLVQETAAPAGYGLPTARVQTVSIGRDQAGGTVTIGRASAFSADA